MYCVHEELFRWIGELGFNKVYSLQLTTPIRIGPFEIVPLKALDENVDSIFHIKVDNLNILNVVDSWIDYNTLEVLKKISPWDLVLWPFQTMRELEVLSPSRSGPATRELPPEWIEQLLALNPKSVVPSSCQFRLEDWSWYNKFFFPITYKQFANEIKSLLPESQVIRLNPAETVIYNGEKFVNSLSLDWVRPIGNQDVDYDFDEKIKPPRTSEIAKNFPGLTFAESRRVINYCQHEIIEQYSLKKDLIRPYFSKKRYWRLALYDHLGNERIFNYFADNNQLRITGELTALPDWITEVPIQKLHAAIATGESLTSMYLRVNDQKLNPEIEEDLAMSEVTEDPLIHCLFSGVFGSYQEVQLQKIKLKENHDG